MAEERCRTEERQAMRHFATVALIWLVASLAHAEPIALYLNPDCPAPTDTIRLVAYQPSGTPELTSKVLSAVVNGNVVEVTVESSDIAILGVPSETKTTIGPLAPGSYELRFFTRALWADGYRPAVLSAMRSFTVQVDPPACTPTSLSVVGPRFQATLVGQAFPRSIQVLAQDALKRPVPGVTLQFSEVYVDEDVAAVRDLSKLPGATLAATSATTDTNGMAEVAASANANAGSALYRAQLWRPDLKLNAYFTLVNLPTQTAEIIAPVVEYFNPDLGRYFITQDSLEADQLDSGALGNWLRTGGVFIAAPSENQSGDLRPVCRFYGSVNPGPNSHFFTADASECAFLRSLQDVTPPTEKRWNYEGLAFSIRPPVSGACPYANSLPVFRAYNDGYRSGDDANHRFTTSAHVYQSMVERGWIGEGAVMCALR